MEKFVPYEKRSKKEKRKLDAQARTTWGSVNPVTRKPQNSKAYNRSKARNWKRDYHEPIPGILFREPLIKWARADSEGFWLSRKYQN